MFQEWKAGTKTMEDVAACFAFFDYGSYSLVGVGEPERLAGVDISRNFLDFWASSRKRAGGSQKKRRSGTARPP